MNQLPNTIQTSEEIIKEAKELCKTNGENEPYFIIGYLKQHYDTLLKSISEDTRDKFIGLPLMHLPMKKWPGKSMRSLKMINLIHKFILYLKILLITLLKFKKHGNFIF